MPASTLPRTRVPLRLARLIALVMGAALIIPTAAEPPPSAAPVRTEVTVPGVGSPTPMPPSAAKPLPEEKPAPAAAKPPGQPASPDLGEQRTAAHDPVIAPRVQRVAGRGPLLAAVSGGWNAAHPNWEHATHGGPRGVSFYDTTVELVPEAIVVEAEPVRFPRAPVSRKRVWFDARTLLPIGMVSYDRRGQPYRSFDGAFGLYEAPTQAISFIYLYLTDIAVLS